MEEVRCGMNKIRSEVEWLRKGIVLMEGRISAERGPDNMGKVWAGLVLMVQAWCWLWEICSTKPVIAERGEDPRVLRRSQGSWLGDVQSWGCWCALWQMKEKLKWHEGRESAEKDERINKTLQAEKEKVLLERPNVI